MAQNNKGQYEQEKAKQHFKVTAGQNKLRKWATDLLKFCGDPLERIVDCIERARPDSSVDYRGELADIRAHVSGIVKAIGRICGSGAQPDPVKDEEEAVN